jgi:UPF0176 protein
LRSNDILQMTMIRTTHPAKTSDVTTSFYKFITVVDPNLLKMDLTNFCVGNSLIGTIVIAEEGVNGSVSGRSAAVEALLCYIRKRLDITELVINSAPSQVTTFKRLKVKVRKEIVSLGLDTVKPEKITGTHVDADEWNNLLIDPEVLVIDTRNNYEIDVGTFKTAVRANTKNFRDFPAQIKDLLDGNLEKPIAMFCTGGIRCEKASAHLLNLGHKHVYQLKGGILSYLDDATKNRSMWEGDCFVFDDRVAVSKDLEPADYEKCHGCRKPLSTADRKLEEYEYGISCHHCIDSLDDTRRAALMERNRQANLVEARLSKMLSIS